MIQSLYLFILVTFITITSSFNDDLINIHTSFKTSVLYCVSDLNQNTRIAYFQNKMTKSFYTTYDGLSITIKPLIPSINYKKIQCLQNNKLLLLDQNNTIYLYDDLINQIRHFDTPNIQDITYVKVSQNQQKILYVSGTNLHIKDIGNGLNEEISDMGEEIESIKCSRYMNKVFDGYCFTINVNKDKIIYFHIDNPQNKQYKSTQFITTFQIAEQKQRIYIGFQQGSIKQYSLQKQLIFYQRSTQIYSNCSILDLHFNFFRNQLIFLNSLFQISTINLSNGNQTLLWTDTLNYCSDNSKLILFSNQVFALFNPLLSSTIQPILHIQSIIASNSLSVQFLFYQICSSQNYYFNSTLQTCKVCISGCKLCDEQTSYCLTCQDGYFKSNQKCLNCKYASLQQESYKLCFQQKEIDVLFVTNQITPVITTTIQISYSVLSGSALLFLFIRFINFWSLISLYYFLNVEAMPYFLLQFLQKIFMILYGSVFEYFGIDITSINMGINERQTNEKMKLTEISTDFVGANLESIITFLYSIFLICVVYDGFKVWLRKFKIYVLQKVKLEACLQQFMGIFIPLIVPLSYFMINLSSNNVTQKINNSLFIWFLGIGTCFPFIYLVLIAKRVTSKQRLLMIKGQIKDNQITSKILSEQINHELNSQANDQINNQTKKQKQDNIKRQKVQVKNIHKQINEKSTNFTKSKNYLTKSHLKQIKTQNKINKLNKLMEAVSFINQQEGQKLLYCINSFTIPFLVSLSNPNYFFFFGLFINTLAVWNAFYAKNWRINFIIQKSIFWIYHFCFIIISLAPSQYFLVSLLIIGLIILGGIHQLITAVVEKIYLIYLVLKHKKIIKDNKIAADYLKTQRTIKSLRAIKSQNNIKSKNKIESQINIENEEKKSQQSQYNKNLCKINTRLNTKIISIKSLSEKDENQQQICNDNEDKLKDVLKQRANQKQKRNKQNMDERSLFREQDNQLQHNIKENIKKKISKQKSEELRTYNGIKTIKKARFIAKTNLILLNQIKTQNHNNLKNNNKIPQNSRTSVQIVQINENNQNILLPLKKGKQNKEKAQINQYDRNKLIELIQLKKRQQNIDLKQIGQIKQINKKIKQNIKQMKKPFITINKQQQTELQLQHGQETINQQLRKDKLEQISTIEKQLKSNIEKQQRPNKIQKNKISRPFISSNQQSKFIIQQTYIQQL